MADYSKHPERMSEVKRRRQILPIIVERVAVQSVFVLCSKCEDWTFKHGGARQRLRIVVQSRANETVK